jgi:MATE family multidrug resistance protein
MALTLIAYTLWRDRRLNLGLLQHSRRMHFPGILRLFQIGAPAGLQMTMESTVFSLSASLISRLGVAASAAHTIVLNIAGFTYMVPLGFSGAVAVLVGQEIGRRNLREARTLGWTGLGLTSTIMLIIALVLGANASSLTTFFTKDPTTINIGSSLLIVVAFFQLADGIQVVMAGALRGLGDTRSSLFAGMFGYWVAACPLGYWLCFTRGKGAVGYWAGLAIGLVIISLILLARWKWKSQNLPGHWAPLNESHSLKTGSPLKILTAKLGHSGPA